MENVKKYSKYKDSGVEWIGDIPAHWEIKRLKYVKSSKKNAFVDGPFGSNLKTEHFVENGEVYVIDSGYITSGKFEIKRNFKMITLEHLEIVKRSECNTNDIIIAKIGANFGMSGILPELDKRSLVSGNTLKLTINREKFNLDFIHLQLLNLKINGEIDLLVKGSAQPALSMGVMENLLFVVPLKLSEQKQIAKYLDQKTTAIDQLIQKKEQLIKLLEEERTVMINQAVTKGLDLTVPMKDSGIEWLGDVPAHWEVKKLSYLTSKVGDGLHGTPKYVESSEYNFINGNNIKRGKICIHETTKFISQDEFLSNKKELNDNTILISINGTIGNLAYYNQEPVMLGKSVAYINCLKDVNKGFVFSYIESKSAQIYIDKELSGSTIKNLSLYSINKMPIPVPNKKEQQKIVTYLDIKTKKIDQKITKTKEQIKLLKEYKTTLISEVVTGKIDVRAAVLEEN